MSTPRFANTASVRISATEEGIEPGRCNAHVLLGGTHQAIGFFNIESPEKMAHLLVATLVKVAPFVLGAGCDAQLFCDGELSGGTEADAAMLNAVDAAFRKLRHRIQFDHTRDHLEVPW